MPSVRVHIEVWSRYGPGPWAAMSLPLDITDKILKQAVRAWRVAGAGEAADTRLAEAMRALLEAAAEDVEKMGRAV